MGKGLAHHFREREPQMFEAYRGICERKLLEPGKLWLWRGAEHWTLNFPTKKHWRHPSKVEWIEAGLRKFVAAYEAQGIREISFPQLGCGNGGLDWDVVRPLMERYLSGLPIPVFVHDYTVDIGLPEHLEKVEAALRRNKAEASFESVLGSMKAALDLSGNELAVLRSDDRFAARMNSDFELTIDESGSKWKFQPDDLRSIWTILQRGLITSNRAGLPVGGGGRELVSLLSVLPQVRAVEIQRGSSVPEIAAELSPDFRKALIAPHDRAQRELAWA